IFLYMDGGAGHPGVKPENLKKLQELTGKGVSLGCAHYAVEVPKGDPGIAWQQMIGGHYEHQFSCNPIWSPDFREFPRHPITRGVKPFSVKDEWYFNMRFREEMKGVTPILVAKPSEQVRKGPYVWPAGPYPHIVEAQGRDEIMMWAVENQNGSRGFGFTGGHFHNNWADDNFRKTVLNALLWISKIDVPPEGLDSAPVSEEELKQNLDPKQKK
ncbi:MAG: ThuA domain-containing protein, partial [Verrucomicrobiota bacterium]|nr:ThuA domain-containing protein [Verrucomicrobiota bacterium]